MKVSESILKLLDFFRNTVDLMTILKTKPTNKKTKTKQMLFLLLRVKGLDLDQTVMILFSVERDRRTIVRKDFLGGICIIYSV